jgi:AmmeMemoRadiSam system protein A/AmmeMemoRadiSam system protein B
LSLVFCGLSPHPPLLVPEIGKDSLTRVEATRAALASLADRVVAVAPDTLVIVTPHGPVRHDALSLLTADRFKAGFRSFSWEVELRGDVPLAERIRRSAAEAGIPVMSYAPFDSERYAFSRGLDHATMVPLYYLWEAGLRARLVVISIAAWSHREHFRFGQVLSHALDAASDRVALVASGDLSHRLIPTAPAGYDPLGVEFDRRVVRDLECFDTRDVLELDDEFIERIGECGLRPIGVMLGAMQAWETRPEVLSYEGPFGVGYCVAEIGIGARRQDDEEEAVLGLVRRTVEAFVRGEEGPALPSALPRSLQRRAAAFVCLKKEGQLRGCIGTTRPTQEDLAHELLRNAVSAASRDPRFEPVRPDELDALRYSVDVLDEPETIGSVDQLDPSVYGVIVRSGPRSAVLLPNIEGIESAEVQVELARRKAGIGPGEPLELQRFRAWRYERKD